MMKVYKVVITDSVKHDDIFDSYLIKVEADELPTIEKHIHEKYPSMTLRVVFEAK